MRKKLVSILALLLSLVFSTIVLAQDMDFSSFSDDELRGIIQSVRDELDRRKTDEDANKILYDKNGIQVYFTGDTSYTTRISDG